MGPDLCYYVKEFLLYLIHEIYPALLDIFQSSELNLIPPFQFGTQDLIITL